jgi:DNA-binding NtrC family response regulator
MPSAMQAKLLRVLQEGELERVGGHEVIRVDVRVVAATNKDLELEIDEGRFRADLFDRLNVVPLRVPALRERLHDVPLLARYFVERACRSNDRAPKSLSDAAVTALLAYAFPGNVRELGNLIERLVILTPGDTITEADVRAVLPLGSADRATGGLYKPGTPLRDMVEAAERGLVSRALEYHQGHITNTAADLGLERSHLYKKMKALGLRRPGE